MLFAQGRRCGVELLEYAVQPARGCSDLRGSRVVQRQGIDHGHGFQPFEFYSSVVIGVRKLALKQQRWVVRELIKTPSQALSLQEYFTSADLRYIVLAYALHMQTAGDIGCAADSELRADIG